MSFAGSSALLGGPGLHLWARRPSLRIIGTLLSQKPKRGSTWTAPISGLLLAVFFLIGSSTLGHGWDLEASGAQVFGKREYWRLLTAPLVHGDLRHLLSNEVFFVLFGWLLNRYFGFWVFPVMSLAAGVLIQGLTLTQYPPEVQLIGASGIVYFMATFWITLFIFIERQIRLARRLLLSSGVALALLFPETFEPQVSYLAHAWGAVLGILLGTLYFALHNRGLRAAEIWSVPEETLPEENLEEEASHNDSSEPGELTQRLS